MEIYKSVRNYVLKVSNTVVRMKRVTYDVEKQKTDRKQRLASGGVREGKIYGKKHKRNGYIKIS